MSEENESPYQPEAKVLSAAAQRALAEAEQRRRDAAEQENGLAKEHGRNGREPTRYGDWEKGGIASDF
jgi:hypothetical protein